MVEGGPPPLDGLSRGWAVAEWLATGAAPRTFFATHYHEITELGERLPERVRNLHVSVREWTAPDETNPEGRPEIIFLHRILPGGADQSYGVHVARLAGLPERVTSRASEILESVSVQHAQQIDTRAIRPAPSANAQLPLFTEYVPHPAIDRLREIKLDALTPLEAFDALRKIKSEAESAGE